MPEEKKLSGTKQNMTSFSPLADLTPMSKNQVMDLAMKQGAGRRPAGWKIP